MQTFYDLQQFLKSFGILIYMKDRKHTLSMVEYEVRELRRLELISKEEFLRAMAIIKHEINLELAEGYENKNGKQSYIFESSKKN